MHIAPLALALALAPASTATVAEHPLIGTWTGAWARGDTSELTITHIDESGAVTGAYCHQRAAIHALGVIELHPVDGTAATIADGTIRFSVARSHLEARLDAPDTERLILTNRSDGHDLPSVISLSRAASPRCTERYRALAVDEVTGSGPSLAELMPTAPEHPLVAHWQGHDPGTDLIVELSVLRVEHGLASGLFCNAWTATSGYYYRIDPDDGLAAPATERGLAIDVGRLHFDFSLGNADRLTMTRTGLGAPKALTLTRTSAPTCAPRYIPEPARSS